MIKLIYKIIHNLFGCPVKSIAWLKNPPFTDLPDSKCLKCDRIF